MPKATEVQLRSDFAIDFGYLPLDTQLTLVSKYEELGRMLGGILNSPEKFLIR